MSKESIVILSAARTPMGGLQGCFKDVAATQLGATAVREALARSGVNGADVGEVIMGCVLPAGLGQAPARQASRGAGLPDSVGATTVNKMCGSGLKAVMLAADVLRAGSTDVMVAGGMESMTGAPHLLPKLRSGYRMGNAVAIDHMFMDGLEDAYDKGRLMGAFAEECAEKYGFTREAQDAFAVESLSRAKQAITNGWFKDEIVPVVTGGRKGDTVVDTDEQPANASPEKIPTLKPAFKKDGTVTAANASSISDGASALVLMREADAAKRGVKPLAKIVAQAGHARLPSEFAIAPVDAMKTVLQQAGWRAEDVDLWEINEAFAVVTMAAMHDLKLDHAKVNIHGGACALGHPIGASGARILTTLLYALARTGKTKGVASLCIGGGEAVAIAVERCI